MQLLLQRMWLSSKSIIGSLFVDNLFQCYTLEPFDCIPYGTYRVVPYPSPKFGSIVPLLENVPNHSYVEIHVGNWPRDTTSCILVGKERGIDCLSSSRAAFNELMHKLNGAWNKKEEVNIRLVLANAEERGSHESNRG